MSRSLIPSGGNDRVMTPDYLVDFIMNRLQPTGTFLDPCRGEGAFYNKFPVGSDWCEIDEGVDFLTYDANKKYDWIITNPPFSIYTKFLDKALQISKNVVFLQLVNATFMNSRYNLLKKHGFGIRQIIIVDYPPKPWPKFGLLLGFVHYELGYKGDTSIIDCR